MPYYLTAAPSNLDSDGVRSYTEGELIAVSRALAETEKTSTDSMTALTSRVTALEAAYASLSTASNVLGSDVNLSSIGAFFLGPSMAQGTTGTWLAVAQVTLTDTAAATMTAKLWDGTTVIASSSSFCAAGGRLLMSLAGIITSPVGNIRISVADGNNTTGKILFNFSGTSKDSSIYGVRIA